MVVSEAGRDSAQGSLPPSRRFNIGGILHDNGTELHFMNSLKVSRGENTHKVFN